MTRRFSLGRLLVLAILLLLTVLGYYFLVLHVPEAGAAEAASIIA